MFNLDESGPSDLMQFLAEPTTVDGIAQWSLSRLWYPAFDNCSLEPKDVLEANQSRYGGFSGGERGGTRNVSGLEPCVPLHLDIKEPSYIFEPRLTSDDVDGLR
ncbi:hypothetical protein FRB94_003012 [Tulasnella sp. JGI-2019a]|nr:hypothetical protein FRB94_003012 [Tulasnella sp. JGI-2019a]KAG9010561.1 hypothetical protein FRB93_003829 [Tulasnella sp. JGI-2019a]